MHAAPQRKKRRHTFELAGGMRTGEGTRARTERTGKVHRFPRKEGREGGR